MSKLLNARDLLELVRQNEAEDREETEAITNADTLGRRIYPGTTRRRPGRAFAAREAAGAQPQGKRGPRNTQLIEAVRPASSEPAAPLPGPIRRGTIQMKAPVIAQSGPGRPAPPAGPDSGPVRDDARTLEMVLPRPQTVPPPAKATPSSPPAGRVAPQSATPAARAPAARSTTEPTMPAVEKGPTRSLSPAQPLRKVSMGVWGRSTGEGSPSSPPAPAPAPALRADAKRTVSGLAPPLDPTTPPSRVSEPPKPVTPAKPATPAMRSPSNRPAAPAKAPEPPADAGPPKSSVASMFSWVTQRAEWAPPQDALESRPPPPPVAAPQPPPPAPAPPEPPAAAPPAQPAHERAPDSSRSLVPNEPIALNTEETLVLVHYDQSLSIDVLADRTGLTEFRVSHVVDNLRRRGVLDDAEPESQPTPMPDTAPTGTGTGPIFGGAAEKRANFAEALRSVETELSQPAAAPLKRADSDDLPAASKTASSPFAGTPLGGDLPAAAKTSPFAGTPLGGDLPAAAKTSPFAGTPLGNRGPQSSPATTRDASPPQSDLDAQPTLLELELEQLREMSGELMRRTDEFAFSDSPVDPEQTIVDNGADDLPAAAAAKPKFPAITPKTVESPPPPVVSAQEPDASEASEGGEGDDVVDDSPIAGGAIDSDADSANALAHFEVVLSKVNPDERAKLASTTATPIELYAFCFDKEPSVIRALWTNINVTHAHARFAAFNHRTAAGLDLIAQRNEFLKDPHTQRRLVRNPMISETLLRRILVPKRLLDIYKLTLDREASERTRASARGYLRNKFATTDAEDRMELIWKTEGRALASLSGLSIDSKTAALICGRQIMSVMLVQSFTRFAATPPSVISHFLKQALVKRQVHLRNALLKHPNCPSDAKRAF